MSDKRKPRILMCRPAFYGVEYIINPWMEAGRGHVCLPEAVRQWHGLYAEMSGAASVWCIEPQPGFPDMVFTANAGLIIGSTFVPSRFRHSERAGEEPFFTQWAREAGYDICTIGGNVRFEGAGDALYDRRLPILWFGFGIRTDENAAPQIAEIVGPAGLSVEPLRLVDPRFYHLDTCLCPLSDGSLLYYPPAFSPDSRARIEQLVPEERLVPVSSTDAEAFACNAVNLDGVVVLNQASGDLKERLSDRGFRTVETPLSEYLSAGGAAKCLTLSLDEPLSAEYVRLRPPELSTL